MTFDETLGGEGGLDDSEGVGLAGTTENSPDLEYSNWKEGESEARVSGQIVPAFAHVIAHLTHASLRFSRAKKTPSMRIGIQIDEGIEGQEDAVVFDDLYLAVSKESRTKENDSEGNPIMEPKSAEDLAADIDEFQHRLNKIARVFGLPMARPSGRSEAAMEAYAAQWKAAVDAKMQAIFDIIVGKDNRGLVNRINWYGFRGLTDKALDKKLRAAGKTAYEEAKQKIAERAKGAGNGNRTAGALRRGGAAPASIE